MRKLLNVCLAASFVLSITACAATPASTSQPRLAGMQAGAQPTGTIKGQLVLPYRVQLSSRTAKAGGFDLLAYFAGQPAQAEEETATAEEPASEASPSPEASAEPAGPLSEAEIQDLTATVDGQEVELEVTEITPSADGEETVVDYEIDEAPVGDGLEVVEISTPEGESVGGAVVDAEPGATTETEITPETTAVLETACEVHGSEKIAALTPEELAALEVLPSLLNKLASLRSILRKDGSFKPNKLRKFSRKHLTMPSASPSPAASPDPSASPSAAPSASPSPQVCGCPEDHEHDDDHDEDRDSRKGDKRSGRKGRH